MLVARNKFSSYADMPAGLRKFVFTPEFSSAEADLQKQFNLTDDQRILIGDQVMDTIFGDQDLSTAVANIRAGLASANLDGRKWQEFVSELVKRDLWAIRDLFGDELIRVLSDNQVGTAGWPDSKVYLKPMTYSAAAGEISQRGGFTLLGAQTRERLRDLIMSRAKGVRVDSQVKEVLVRPVDFGGLGLDSESADKTIKAINDIIASVPVMSEDEYTDWLAEEARKKTEAEQRAKEAEIKTSEDKEIADIRAKMPPPAKVLTVLDSAVEQAYASLAWKPTDEYLINRLRHIISSRMRDVRSSLEVEQLLQRDTKVGGVGLEKDKAHELAKQIEVAYTVSHEQVLGEEKQKIDTQMVEQKTKIEERKRRDAEDHAKWYQEKILSRKQGEDQKKQLAEQMKQSFMANTAQPPAPEAHPVDIKEAKKEKERFGEMIPAVAAGAAPIATPQKPIQSSAPVPSAKPPVPLPLSTPQAPVQAARNEVKVSKDTIVKQPLAAGFKPRIEDVKYGPRLVSLVDELKNITLSEFRRLAKDPQAAADKIFQKIETLGGESFEKRTQGVTALQSSPLQRSYLSLVGESFRQGKSVQELADAKRAAGEDDLSPAEISAVISLNSKLHY
jgi:hypothetical protein